VARRKWDWLRAGMPGACPDEKGHWLHNLLNLRFSASTFVCGACPLFHQIPGACPIFGASREPSLTGMCHEKKAHETIPGASKHSKRLAIQVWFVAKPKNPEACAIDQSLQSIKISNFAHGA
jgi:hypothetical protein